MDPTSLRVFLAVARRLNFTRAAEDVHLSQPAVTRRIQQLEHELGARLFEQIGRSVSLTDAGRFLAREAERLLGDMDRLGESLRGFEAPGQGSLRVGASSTPGLYLLPRVLAGFQAAFPRVSLQYRVENSERIVQALLRNELDLAMIGSEERAGPLVSEAAFDDEIVCFSASPGRAPEPGVTLVTREPGSATRRLVERWLSRRRLAGGPEIELQSPEAVKAVVAGGLGISFISRMAIEDELARGTLHEIPAAGLPLRRRLTLVRHADKAASAVMASFLEHLRGALEERAKVRPAARERRRKPRS